MKHWLRLIFVAAIAGLVAFAITRYLAPPPESSAEISWLVSEFNLSPDQAEQIRTLHEDYDPICAAHCAAILDTRKRIETAASSESREEAEGQLIQLTAKCHESTQAHLEAVAAAMDPSQGERYLALISPQLSAHQHGEPFGLR